MQSMCHAAHRIECLTAPSALLCPRRGRKREEAAPAGGTRGLRGLRGGLDLDRHPWPDDLGFPLPWRPQEAVLQEIEVGAAKHLPLDEFEPVYVALHGT